MKICFLAPANSVHSYRWVKYFLDKGYEISWFSLHPDTAGVGGRVNYIQISDGCTLWKLIKAVIAFRKAIGRINPDIFHVHSVGIYGLVGALMGFHPAVATAWGSDVIESCESFIKRPVLKYVLNQFDLITTDANHMISSMKGLGIKKEKLALVYFGVDTEKFYPRKPNAILREKLGLGNSPAVISLRNFYPTYDIESLLKAAALVLKEIPETKFIIAGEGPLGPSLKDTSQALDLTASVNFIGKVNNDILPDYLGSVDIYVSTSLSDAGISASTAEAMSCAVPVIVTDSGENKHWISDGSNGFLVPLQSPVALAKKIIFLLKHKEERLRIGNSGRKVIKQRNDYYTQMDRMDMIYKDLIKK